MSHPLIVVGAQTYSKARSAYPPNAPEYADWAAGAYSWSNGKAYLDTVAALGAVILGHQHPEVEYAVREQLGRGVSFSLPTRLEGELAELLVGLLPHADWQVRYGKNGTEVVSRAVRIARAVTGRDKVLHYANGYHGSEDWCMTRGPKNGGVPEAVCRLTHSVERHNLDDIAAALETYRPAALVLEAVVTTDPVLPPAEYFPTLRRLCDRYGALLVLDEMVTGFRCGIPGAVTAFGVEPDLICYGKAIANGYPLSVLVGRREYMGRIERDVFMSSTFGGEAVSLAAGIAAIKVLVGEDVPMRLAETGKRLAGAYRAAAAQYGVATDVYGYPQRMVQRWADPDEKQRFMAAMADCGVLNAGYFNLMLAMTDPATERALCDAVRESMAVVGSFKYGLEAA